MSSPDALDNNAFWSKLRRVPEGIVRRALTLYVLLTDPGAPPWARALVIAALVYLVNPLDAIPDILPGVGLADDLAGLAFVLERLSRYVTPEVQARAGRLLSDWLTGCGDTPDEPAAAGRPHTRKGEPEHDA